MERRRVPRLARSYVPAPGRCCSCSFVVAGGASVDVMRIKLKPR